jgi:hypothetical protein
LRLLIWMILIGTLPVVFAPYVLPARFTEGLTDWSIGAWVTFALVAPLVLGPVALHQGPSILTDEQTLTVPTTLGVRQLDLKRISRVWARGIPGKYDVTQLVGVGATDGTHVWFHWTDGNDTYERLAPLLRDAASRPGVTVSERARLALKVPGQPPFSRRTTLWLRGFGWYLLYIALVVGGTVLDVHLLVDRYVGYDFGQ